MRVSSVSAVVHTAETNPYAGPLSISNRPIVWPGRRHSMAPPTSDWRMQVALKSGATMRCIRGRGCHEPEHHRVHRHRDRDRRRDGRHDHQDRQRRPAVDASSRRSRAATRRPSRVERPIDDAEHVGLDPADRPRRGAARRTPRRSARRRSAPDRSADRRRLDPPPERLEQGHHEQRRGGHRDRLALGHGSEPRTIPSPPPTSAKTSASTAVTAP